MARLLALFLAILVFVSAAQTAQSEPSCTSVVLKLAACLPYLRGNSDLPSMICCVGAQSHSLHGEVSNSKDRQAVCECLKKVLPTVEGVDVSKIPQIPKLCDVDLVLPPVTNKTKCSELPLGY